MTFDSLPAPLGVVTFSPAHLVIRAGHGQSRSVFAGELYDNAPQNLALPSGQRLSGSLDGPAEITITAVEADDDGLWIMFNDTERRFFGYDFLETRWLRRPRPFTPLFWDGAEAATLPVFAYDACLGDDDTLRQVLTAVATCGFARLKGGPAEPGVLDAVVARFGYIRETNYGRVFDVRSTPNFGNLADTDRGLEPHTDNPYRHPVPGLQILHALRTDPDGGASRLVDGYLAARTLQAQDPGAYALLAGHDALFQWVGKAGALAARAPVLTCNALGDCIGVKFNHRSFVGVVAPDAIAARWRLAYRQFASLINDAKHSFRFHMAPGDVVVMDNERVLHGRDAFNATTSDRWLQGAYADRHELLSRLQTLHDAAVQGRIDDVEGLFSSPAAGLAYGEHLSLRDHMLQTAAILHRQGATDSLVAAGLLHDIGWLMPGARHEEAGADLLLDLFGPQVSEPVRRHVDAKRWLVTTDDDYVQHLSAASRETLARQGGPMSDDEARAFKSDPFFNPAVQLRRADDQAKIAARDSLPFPAYRSLLYRLAADRLDRT